jgi:tetratricopeptide (TPR) repeat protein
VILCFGLLLVALAGDPAGFPAGSPADSAPADTLAKAKAHFDAGNAHYAAGRYKEAIIEFQAGHGLVPRPSFLLNLGQAYRKLGDLGRAKEAYVGYLRSLPEESPLRDQALKILAEIEVQLQGQERRPEPQPPARAAPVPAPQVEKPAAEPPSRSGRLWLAAGLGAVGAALVGTGVFFELRAKRAADDLSRIDREGGIFDADKDRRGRRDERLGVGFIVAGAAAAVTGVGVAFMMDSRPAADRSAAVLAPVVTGRSAGLTLALRF